MSSILVGVAVLVTMCSAQLGHKCKDDIHKYQDCVKDKLHKLSDDMHHYYDQLKDRRHHCYDDNHCHPPPDHPDDRKPCYDHLRDKFADCVQHAVQPRLDFEKYDDDDYYYSYNDYYWRNGHKDDGRQWDDNSRIDCDDKGNPQGVKDCLRKVRDDAAGEADRHRRYDSVCDIRKQCLDENPIGGRCKRAVQKIRDASCRCGKAQYQDRASIPECSKIDDRWGPNDPGDYDPYRSCDQNTCYPGF